MSERAAQATSRYRYSALLMGFFASLALLLAVIGIYGVMSYAVSTCKREIGVRMALGAQPIQILRLAITDGLVLILIGLILGVAGALAATRVLTGQLYEVTPSDPTTFVIVLLVLIAAGLLACYIPAQQATKVDPALALRYE